METFSIMEPCCIGHQLPQLLKKYPLATWQSNGDVTFDKLMKAISCLAGNSLTVKVVIPMIDIPMLRLLLWYRQREWLKEVAILTKDDQTALMRSQLGMDFPLTARHHDSVVESLLVIEGEKATVIVQGALLSVVTPGQYHYTTYVGTDQERIDMLVSSAWSLFRLAGRKGGKKGKEATEETDEKPSEPAAEQSEDNNEKPVEHEDTTEEPAESVEGIQEA